MNWKPYPEHAVVRIRVSKRDDQGRGVAAGALGTIVHVYPTRPDEQPAYIIEVVLADARGVQVDAHIFDALHEELAPVARMP
jgi:hypothetical protein